MSPLTELPGFSERVRRHAWTGSRSLVPYVGARLCRRCSAGTLVVLDAWSQEPLFFHGGHGEARRVTVGWCQACGRTSLLRSESVRPTHRVRLEVA